MSWEKAKPSKGSSVGECQGPQKLVGGFKLSFKSLKDGSLKKLWTSLRLGPKFQISPSQPWYLGLLNAIDLKKDSLWKCGLGFEFDPSSRFLEQVLNFRFWSFPI